MDTAFIHRDLESALDKAYQYFPVITITGPRQSGKTTLIKRHFSNLAYYSLEDLNIRDFANSDPIAFLSRHEEGMILDEIHNAPKLLSYIQGIVDETPQRRFILSGSSNFAMMKDISQSLAGRTALFELLPLSFSEAIGTIGDWPLDKLMLNGLYPSIVSGKNLPELFYPAYVKTYIERDVRDLLKVRDMLLFNKFLRLCAGRAGSLFKASEIANETGASVNTIISWLSVLQASYIIVLLQPYYENSSKRLVKTPKLYFTDTGLACHLLDIETESQLARDKMRGALFENFIVMEALKYRCNQGRESNLSYYRDSHNNEVDLIVRKPDGLTGIEIKSAMTYNPEFESTLKKLGGWVKSPVIDKAIVYAGDYENVAGEIKLLNYKNLPEALRTADHTEAAH